MKKFYYFLQENPNYPEMMYAESKAEVKSLILENLGKNYESAILNILSEEEFNKMNGNDPAYQDAGNFNNGNDFFNSIIKGVNNKLTAEAKEACFLEAKNNENIITSIESNPNGDVTKPQNIEPPIKYFDAGGEHFKMENGKIYKKVWKEISDKNSFRIISSTTSKPITSEKYKIEELIWEEI